MTEPFTDAASTDDMLQAGQPDERSQMAPASEDAGGTDFHSEGARGSALSVSGGGGALGNSEFTARDEYARGSAAALDEQVADPQHLQAAHQLLQAAVLALKRRGRLATAAGVKPEMKRLSSGRFSEDALGFVGFRAFLDDAQRKGVATLTKAPVGPDVVVSVPEQDARLAPSLASAAARRVRQNVWRAFVDWRPGLRRMYDRELGDIRLLQVDSDPTEGTEAAVLLKEIAQHAERFIEIDPIRQTQQLEWMREFVATLDDETSALELLETLRTDRPLAAFARAVRRRPSVALLWHALLTERVKAVIDEWVAHHKVALTVEDQVRVGVSPPSASSSAGRRRSSHAARRTNLGDLRASILSVISELPTEELMQIKVPVAYLFKE